MKKIIIIFAAVLMTTASFGQYKNWALEAEYGIHNVDDESATTVDKSMHLGIGLRYNFNPKIGLGLTAAHDKGTLEDFNGMNVDFKYSRINLEAYLNVFKIVDLHSDYFTVLVHGGPGLSMIKTDNNYDENIFNLHGGFTGLFKLSSRVALKADYSLTGNISQSRTTDGTFEMTNRGTNSTLHNFSAGLVFYLGKKKAKNHADWYKAKPVEPMVVNNYPVINNYLTEEVEGVLGDCNCVYIGHEYVFFDHDKSIVKETALEAIYKIFVALNENPEFKLEIVGWASATSSDAEYNLKLSKRRADTLREKLINMNIDPSRISTSANGKDFDYSKNDVHDIARRVELIIIKNN